MSTVHEYSIGVRFDEIDDAVTRVMVSSLALIPKGDAAHRGFIDCDVIVPRDRRPATKEELAAIEANDAKPHTVIVSKLPLAVGRAVIDADSGEGFEHPLVRPEHCRHFGEGLYGVSFGIRESPPGERNVSVDSEGRRSGDHIDCLDPRQKLSILNLGPGLRWHRLTPGFLRAETDAALGHRGSRIQHAKDLLDRQDEHRLRTYWFRLDPPSVDPTTGRQMVDAILDVPAAQCLHDGSTLGAVQPSTAVFVGMPVSEGA